MAASLVQSAEGSSSSATITLTFSGATTSGNLIVVRISSDAYKGTNSEWTFPTGCSQEGFHGSYMAYLTSAGETLYEFDIGSAANAVWVIEEWSGLDISGGVDASNGQIVNSSGGNYDTASVTPSNGVEVLLLACWGASSSAANLNGTLFSAPTNSFTEGDYIGTTTYSNFTSSAYRTVTGDGSTSYSSNLGYPDTAQSRSGLLMAIPVAATGGGASVEAVSGAVEVAGQVGAASATANVSVEAASGSIEAAGQQGVASATANQTVTAASGALEATGQTGVVSATAHVTVEAASGALETAGQTGVVSASGHVAIEAVSGALEAVGQQGAVSATASASVEAVSGSIVVSGQAGNVAVRSTETRLGGGFWPGHKTKDVNAPRRLVKAAPKKRPELVRELVEEIEERVEEVTALGATPDIAFPDFDTAQIIADRTAYLAVVNQLLAIRAGLSDVDALIDAEAVRQSRIRADDMEILLLAAA